MHGVRDIALFSCKLYALYFGATLQAQVTTATIGQFPRQTNAVTPGVAAFAFQQFFAVFANFARNTIPLLAGPKSKIRSSYQCGSETFGPVSVAGTAARFVLIFWRLPA